MEVDSGEVVEIVVVLAIVVFAVLLFSGAAKDIAEWEPFQKLLASLFPPQPVNSVIAKKTLETAVAVHDAVGFGDPDMIPSEMKAKPLAKFFESLGITGYITEKTDISGIFSRAKVECGKPKSDLIARINLNDIVDILPEENLKRGWENLKNLGTEKHIELGKKACAKKYVLEERELEVTATNFPYIECKVKSVECTVNNFNVPQQVSKFSEWIKGYGDPQFLLYWQSFPPGEDKAWDSWGIWTENAVDIVFTVFFVGKAIKLAAAPAVKTFAKTVGQKVTEEVVKTVTTEKAAIIITKGITVGALERTIETSASKTTIEATSKGILSSLASVSKGELKWLAGTAVVAGGAATMAAQMDSILKKYDIQPSSYVLKEPYRDPEVKKTEYKAPAMLEDKKTNFYAASPCSADYEVSKALVNCKVFGLKEKDNDISCFEPSFSGKLDDIVAAGEADGLCPKKPEDVIENFPKENNYIPRKVEQLSLGDLELYKIDGYELRIKDPFTGLTYVFSSAFPIEDISDKDIFSLPLKGVEFTDSKGKTIKVEPIFEKESGLYYLFTKDLKATLGYGECEPEGIDIANKKCSIGPVSNVISPNEEWGSGKLYEIAKDKNMQVFEPYQMEELKKALSATLRMDLYKGHVKEQTSERVSEGYILSFSHKIDKSNFGSNPQTGYYVTSFVDSDGDKKANMVLVKYVGESKEEAGREAVLKDKWYKFTDTLEIEPGVTIFIFTSEGVLSEYLVTDCKMMGIKWDFIERNEIKDRNFCHFEESLVRKFARWSPEIIGIGSGLACTVVGGLVSGPGAIPSGAVCLKYGALTGAVVFMTYLGYEKIRGSEYIWPGKVV